MNNEVGPKYINQNKKYGLIIPTKSNPTGTIAKPQKSIKLAAFDDDDELDEDEVVTTKPKVNTNETKLKKASLINIEKALEEDPNVFEYDSLYDKMEEAKKINDPKSKNQSKEPKYIAGLMKAAALRQLEYERREDRKVQSEREKEGDLFKDKESFVTEAYRKRMEERQILDEEERRQTQIEELLDVKKAKNLSGFYDNMLKLRTGELKIEEESEKLERERKEREEKERKEENEKKFMNKSKNVKSKTFRTRKEEESSEEEPEEVKKDDENLKPNDQDEEISDDDDDKIKEPKIKKAKMIETVEKKDEIKVEEEKPIVVKKETKEEKWKRLFTKRTVGKVFDNEVKEYFKRKNDILSLKFYIERE